MVESDGIEDAVAGAIRVALTVAAYRIEQAARDRQQRATEAARGSTTEYQGYVDQHRAQRDAARAELMFTADQPGWWDTATPEQVGRAWETAQLWRGSDTDIDRQARQIKAQVKRRWGIDPTEVVPGGVAAAVSAEQFAEQAHRADQQRTPEPATAEQQPVKAADRADRADLVTAGPLVARPGEHPRVPSIEELIGSRPDAQRAAAAARGVTDPRATEAVAVASAHQARPASSAVATLATPAAGRARTPRTPSRGAARDTGRSEGR